MKYILLLLIFTASISAKPAKSSKEKIWIDPVKANAEHPKFKYIGEYKSKTTDHFYQVTLLKDGQFLITTYEKGLPGRGWDKTITAKSEIFTQDQLDQASKNWTKVLYKSPTLGKQAPENVTLKMPEGFSNVTDGILMAGEKTTKEVGSFKMHLEFMLPFKPHQDPSHQDNGNSGIYIFNNYEIQVLNTFALDYLATQFPIKTKSKNNQWCGCLYKMKLADVNMTLPPLTLANLRY